MSLELRSLLKTSCTSLRVVVSTSFLPSVSETKVHGGNVGVSCDRQYFKRVAIKIDFMLFVAILFDQNSVLIVSLVLSCPQLVSLDTVLSRHIVRVKIRPPPTRE